MSFEAQRHNLQDYAYYNLGPLNEKFLCNYEWKPSEKMYREHYKYFSYLYKLGRIKPEQGIVKFIAPQSNLDQINQVKYERLFAKEVHVDVQGISSIVNQDDEVTGAKVGIIEKSRRSLDYIFNCDHDRRIGEITPLKHYVNKYWEQIASATEEKPFKTVCASYVDERDLDFEPIVDLKQSLDMLDAVRLREDVHFPKLFIGSSGAYSSMLNDDLDLLSVSVMYCGRPKIYYAIPETEFDKYTELVRRNCHRQIPNRRENNCLILPPHVLRAAGIQYATLAQNPGDIIYMFGKTIWYSVNTGPSFEHIGSCGHYCWGKAIVSRVPQMSMNLKYNAMSYDEDELKALETFVNYQEAFWERNRKKRLQIKDRPDYLDKRRVYDRRAKAKQTPEMREEQVRRRMLSATQQRLDNPEKKLKRRTALSRYVAPMFPKLRISDFTVERKAANPAPSEEHLESESDSIFSTTEFNDEDFDFSEEEPNENATANEATS